MGEFHQQVAIGSSADLMLALYHFTVHASQTVVSLVTNGGFTALWVDSAEGGGAPDLYKTSVATAGAFGNNSFMVLEVNFANPGGRKWQVKITRVSTTVINIEASPNGGWVIASAVSGATDSFVGQPTTGALALFGGSGLLLGAGDQVYLSSADLDTYGIANKYGWIRGVIYDSSGSTVPWAFYVGGYIPFDETNDTDPFVVLVGAPQLNIGSQTWSNTSTGATNRNRVPSENGLAVTSLVASGYAAAYSNYALVVDDKCLTRAGTNVEMQVFVHDIGTSQCLGYFGENTMVGISDTVSLLTVSTASPRIAVNNFGMRWNP